MHVLFTTGNTLAPCTERQVKTLSRLSVHLVGWVQRGAASTHDRQDVAPEEHLNNVDAALVQLPPELLSMTHNQQPCLRAGQHTCYAIRLPQLQVVRTVSRNGSQL